MVKDPIAKMTKALYMAEKERKKQVLKAYEHAEKSIKSFAQYIIEKHNVKKTSKEIIEEWRAWQEESS